MARIITVAGHTPDVSRAGFLAPDAVIAGDVVLGAGVSVWYGCVIRGEYAPVRIGARTNVQDLSIMHTDPGSPCTIGEDVTIGHRAIVHGATVHDEALIGMGATVLNNATIGKGSIVGAGAVVRERFEVPPAHLAVGVPAKLKAMPAPPDGPYPNVAAYLHLAELYAEADPEA
jgi:carbonic anhydrase/acetyltransferase-like protein (isoleucine patch superfamily)